ncbi:hypothetical protein K8Q94_02005 [Candidatus Nomurabacteria bacterium]|nr:hypothetical protein [Candidatus Nomurabacteria bacterium]
MLENDKGKLNRLEEMKVRLFSKGYKVHDPYHTSFSESKEIDVPDVWATEKQENTMNKFFMKTSMFKKFFMFSIGFFILAMLFASYSFFFGGNTVSNDNIDIAVLGNTFTAGGEELPLQIEITNRNNADLQLVDLVIDYPKGSSDASGNMSHLRQSIGTVSAGSVHTENTKIVLFGEQDSIQPVKISIEYRVEGSNAIFVKEKDYPVSISSAPINLSIDAPTEASPNQDITLNIKATLNSTKTVNKMLLRVDYPIGFQFDKAIPMPSFGNNVWSLGDLAPGAESNITILGKMSDVSDGEDKTFHVWSGSQADNDKTLIGIVFNSLGHTINIKKPFIDAQLFINGVYQREYAVDSKTPIQGQINWVNNLPTKVNDLQIVAKISGNAVNRKTINTQGGFYDSNQNTIIWDKNADSTLSEVEPGASGALSFSFSPISLFSAGSIANSPTVNIDVSINGKQAVEGNVLQQLNNSESKIIRITSDLGIANKILYYSGSFKNNGPIPPKVGQETTYTVVWTLSNTANNISKAQLMTTLPPWVRFVGSISPANEDLNYNPSTHDLVWNIGGIPRGTGITEADREISFQLAFTPSSSQVATSPTLVNNLVLTGHDDFANVNIQVNKGTLNISLSNDSNASAGSNTVIQ